MNFSLNQYQSKTDCLDEQTLRYIKIDQTHINMWHFEGFRFVFVQLVERNSLFAQFEVCGDLKKYKVEGYCGVGAQSLMYWLLNWNDAKTFHFI